MTPGTLSSLLDERVDENIDNLKIIGSINGADIFRIRQMAGATEGDNGILECLDLSEATIVEGDDFYIDYYGKRYYTNEKEIGPLMFADCKTLKEILFPFNTTSIAGDVLRNTPIMRVFIPKNVENLASYAFDGCNTLQSVDVDVDNLSYCSEDGVVFSADMRDLLLCPMGKVGEYKIPLVTERICDDAFRGSLLSKVIFSSNLKEIGKSAFCLSHLQEVLLPNSIIKISEYCFSQMGELKTITIPSAVTRLDYRAFAFCENLEAVHVHFAKSPNSISNNPFEGSFEKDPILYVPMGCKAVFSSESPWSLFSRIREFDSENTSNVSRVKEEPLSIKKEVYGVNGIQSRQRGGLKIFLYEDGTRKKAFAK